MLPYSAFEMFTWLFSFKQTASLKILNQGYSQNRLSNTQLLLKKHLLLSQHWEKLLYKLKPKPRVSLWLTRPDKFPVNLEVSKVTSEIPQFLIFPFLGMTRTCFPQVVQDDLGEK